MVLFVLQFFSGWWFLIDAISVYGQTTALQIVLGVMGTISLVMVNSVTQAQVNTNSPKQSLPMQMVTMLQNAVCNYFIPFQMNGDIAFSGGCLEARGARIWIFVGFVLGFAAIIAAVWSMIASFSNESS